MSHPHPGERLDGNLSQSRAGSAPSHGLRCRAAACRCGIAARHRRRRLRQRCGARELAALARQLDLLDRLAEHAATTAPQERARYHFDYARLRADLQRVRAGVQDYLVPQRAQPRDPVPLAGDYTAAARRDKEAPSP
jgi:RAQPRD family integrative conjugative element protein